MLISLPILRVRCAQVRRASVRARDGPMIRVDILAKRLAQLYVRAHTRPRRRFE